MIPVKIDRAAAVPPFEQIRRQLASMAGSELPPGFRLPPVRQLAAQLGVAPGTVARAYRQLELAGVVDTRGRHGTFIAGGDGASRRRAARAARAYARAAAEAGMSPDQALELVARVVRRSGAKG